MWIATLNKYLLAGALLLAVLVASGIAAQLFATSGTPQSSSLEDGDQALYGHGYRLRPLIEGTIGSPTLNIYGPGGQAVTEDLAVSQGVHHSLADHLGSTRAVWDADSIVVAINEYGPHGETAASGVASAEVRYRYTGHPYDPQRGLYQTPARGYDPTIGRFLSTDPRRQDASPYAYTGNDPIGFVDLTGNTYVPFYLMSGFIQDNTLSNSKVSRFAQSVQSAITGSDSSLRTVYPANRFFDLTGDLIPGDLFRVAGSKALRPPGGARSTTEHHGDILFWLVGDETPMETPYDADEVFRLWRSRNPGMAERIVILDFSGDKDRSRGIRESLSAAEIDHGLIRVRATTLPPDRPLMNKTYITKFEVGGRPMQRYEFKTHVAKYVDELGQRLRVTPHFYGHTDPQSGPGVFGGTGHVPPTNPDEQIRGQLLEMNHTLVDMSEEMLIPPIIPTGED